MTVEALEMLTGRSCIRLDESGGRCFHATTMEVVEMNDWMMM